MKGGVVLVDSVIPRRATWARRVVTGVFLLLCGYLILQVGPAPQINNFDFPLAVLSGERLLHGEIPYKDYLVPYGPLYPVLHGLGQWLFGFLEPAEGARAWATSIALGFYGMVLVAAHKRIRSPMSYLLLLAYLAVLAPMISFFAYYSLVPLLLLMGLCVPANTYLSRPVTNPFWKDWNLWLLLVGVVSLLLLRLNFGAYLAAGIVFVLLCQGITGDSHTRCRFKGIAVASLVVIGIAFLLMATAGIAGSYAVESLSYLQRFSSRHLALQPRLENPVALRGFAVLVTSALLMLGAAIRLAWKRDFDGRFLLLLMGVPFMHYVSVRYDLEHCFPLLVLPAVAWLVLDGSTKRSDLEERAGARSWGWRMAAGTFAVALLAPNAAHYSEHSWYYLRQANAYWMGSIREGFVNTNGVLVHHREALLVNHLKQTVPADEAVLIAPKPGTCESATHGCVNLSLYLAMEKLPRGYLWYFDTPTTPFREAQERIIKSIKQHYVQWVVIQGMLDPTLDYQPGNPPEDDLLYRFILGNYEAGLRIFIPSQNRYYMVYRKM